MSVGSYTYGTVAGVHRRIGWVVSGHADFGSSTIPSLTDVELLLDQIAAEIHAKMYESGYTVATKTNVTTNAPRAVTWLEALNETGAAALILQSFPVAGDAESDEDKPEAFYRKQYENGLKLIAGVFLDRAGLSRDHALSELLVCTSLKDEDGNEKEPLFTRNTFGYPGVSPASNAEEDDD